MHSSSTNLSEQLIHGETCLDTAANRLPTNVFIMSVRCQSCPSQNCASARKRTISVVLPGVSLCRLSSKDRDFSSTCGSGAGLHRVECTVRSTVKGITQLVVGYLLVQPTYGVRAHKQLFLMCVHQPYVFYWPLSFSRYSDTFV